LGNVAAILLVFVKNGNTLLGADWNILP